MSKTVTYTQRVEFGDCDPARIVWFPNFFRWIDAASRHFFVQCGVPPWHETEASHGIIGTPLVLDIAVHIAEWRAKSFVQRYRITRSDGHGPEGGPTHILSCDEVRIFAARRDGGGIRALPIPADLQALCL
jgi:4-hydroxybenzoyl-CoA thioesterase